MKRRHLLTLAGAAFVTAAARRLVGAAGDALTRTGLQLYTVRSILARDFQGTLERVAEIGYSEVEFAGYFDRSPAEVRAALQATGLSAPAAHVPIEALRQNWAQTLDVAATVGHRYLVVPWIPAEDRTLSGYQAVADLFNRAGRAAREAGVHFAYHNHDFEFATVGGRVAYDVLLAETDPAVVEFEMDLFWVTKGGADPLAYFERFPGRFPLVHVKDMDAAGQMVDVGQGAIDFKRIFAARQQAGIRHYFVEHDNPPSPLESIRHSYQYLKTLEF